MSLSLLVSLSLFQITSPSIRVAVVNFAPCVIQENGQPTGLDIEIWETITRTFPRLQFEYVRMPTVGEALDAVYDNRVDIALGGITMTSEREERVDFSHPYVEAGLRLVVRKNKELSFGDLISRIFASGAIYQILLTLCAFIFVCAHIVWRTERRKTPENFPSGYVPGILNACYYVFISITTVGFGDKVCRSGLGKMLTCIIIFAGLLFYGSIMGSFAAAFNQAYEHHYPDIDDLRVATQRGTTAAAYLEGVNVVAQPSPWTALAIGLYLADPYRPRYASPYYYGYYPPVYQPRVVVAPSVYRSHGLVQQSRTKNYTRTSTSTIKAPTKLAANNKMSKKPEKKPPFVINQRKTNRAFAKTDRNTGKPRVGALNTSTTNRSPVAKPMPPPTDKKITNQTRTNRAFAKTERSGGSKPKIGKPSSATKRPPPRATKPKSKPKRTTKRKRN